MSCASVTSGKKGARPLHCWQERVETAYAALTASAFPLKILLPLLLHPGGCQHQRPLCGRLVPAANAVSSAFHQRATRLDKRC